MFKIDHKKIISFLLILSFVVPYLLVSKPKKAEAVVGVLGCGSAVAASLGITAAAGIGATVVGAIFSVPVSNITHQLISSADVAQNTISAGANAANTTKECILDGLASIAKYVLIKTVTASIVNWINSGFEGGPSFITNIEGFLMEATDAIVGEYINSSDWAFLCSPFSLQVKIALLLNFSTYRPSCTLTQVVGNIDNAIADMERLWDWNTWVSITSDSNNNAFGAYINATIALNSKIDSKLANEKLKALWNKGFKDFQVCDDNGYCEVQTPGAIINDQLSFVLGSGFRDLELADEINEILGALLLQLMKQALGPGGLLGSSSPSYGQPSFINQLIEEEVDTSGIRNTASSTLEAKIRDEEFFLETITEIWENFQQSNLNLNNLLGCYERKNRDTWRVLESNVPVTTGFNFSRNRTEESLPLSSISSTTTFLLDTLGRRIASLGESVEREKMQSEQSLNEFRIILQDMASSTNSTELDDAVRRMQQTTGSDVINLPARRINIENQITELSEQIATANARCESFYLTQTEKDTLMCVPISIYDTSNCTTTPSYGGGSF